MGLSCRRGKHLRGKAPSKVLPETRYPYEKVRPCLKACDGKSSGIFSSITQTRSELVGEETLCLPEDFCIPGSHIMSIFWQFPIIDPPPPFPDTGPDSLALELGAAVPMPPAKHGQIPQDTLGQRQDDLVAHGDEGNHPFCLGVLDAGQIRLLEAEIRDRREISPSWSWADHFAGDGGCG